MEKIFFDNWSTLFRTLAIGTFAYISLIFFLRISGKRTLSKMNAFDFVVTVALGSTLASILINKDVNLSEGVLAFVLLIGLQFIITWSSVRISWIRRLVTGEPTLVFFRGKYMNSALRRARVTHEEVLAAIRSAGFATLREVEAVVLETDSSFSVIKSNEITGFSTLHGIERSSTESE